MAVWRWRPTALRLMHSPGSRDLPAARGQSYRLPAGSFFSITDGQISRVVTYYNLSDWIAQVS